MNTVLAIILTIVCVPLLAFGVLWTVAAVIDALGRDFSMCRCGDCVLLGGERRPVGDVVHGLSVCQPGREAL